MRACTCATHEGVLKHNQLLRLMQFLIRLNDVYQPIRSNLLASDPLPDVEAFNVVSGKESHRGLHPSTRSRVLKHNQLLRLMQFLIRLNDVYQPIRSNLLASDPLPDVEAFNVVSGKESHRGLHPSTRSSTTQPAAFAAQRGAFTSSRSVTIDNAFTKEQMTKILALINEKRFGSTNANMAANIVLFDVLVIPEYCVSLLYVHKLIKDSKLFVGFDEHKFYIKDLKVIKTVGIGNKSGGLYMFDEDENGESKCVLLLTMKKQPLQPKYMRLVIYMRGSSLETTSSSALSFTTYALSLQSYFTVGLRVLRASVQAPYRCMTSTTCEVIWLTHLLKDLDVEGLLLVHQYCDSTYAIQIAANPVFHEKTKHFEIDVHLVGVKVTSGMISTVK
nr:ribonuclease H-like domain-containing protein [Tanacetum cinerariifolium]